MISPQTHTGEWPRFAANLVVYAAVMLFVTIIVYHFSLETTSIFGHWVGNVCAFCTGWWFCKGVPLVDIRKIITATRFYPVLLLILGTAFLGACTPNTEVINYRTYTDPERGIFFIVDGQVLDNAALISGVGVDQQRVIITRQGH